MISIPALISTQKPETSNERNFAAFRMGASIYVGTFLLGNNWDYRLVFLVFVAPQIVAWMRSASRLYLILAWISMVLVLVSCWHLWISIIPLDSIIHSWRDLQKFWDIFDEVINWLLFASLAYLFFASLPAWLKEIPQNIFSRVGFRPQRHEDQNRPVTP